jgi:formate/nitrite transporter FocA (FNT family)
MDRTRERYYRGLFWVAAVYDLSLGVAFTFFGRQVFDMLGIGDQYPSGGYVPLIGAFLFVIGVAYVLIARGDLYRNVDLITVGILYKFAYAAIAMVFWALGEAPHISFALFGVADAVFFVLMAECLAFLRRHPKVVLSPAV